VNNAMQLQGHVLGKEGEIQVLADLALWSQTEESLLRQKNCQIIYHRNMNWGSPHTKMMFPNFNYLVIIAK